MDEQAALAVQETGGAIAVADIEGSLARMEELRDMVRKVLERGEKAGDGDYSRLPGTSKDTMHKAGAEKLAKAYSLSPTYKVDRLPDGMHREFLVTCELVHMSGVKVGEGVGSCSTWESKYRWRYGSDCPACGAATIKRSKFPDPRTGEKGWYCFDKIGGCGQQFPADAKFSTERRENLDIADVWNTVLKMAKKRAYVDAVLEALGCSNLFTQDLEERPPAASPAEPEARATGGSGKRSSAPPTQKQHAAKPASGEGGTWEADWEALRKSLGKLTYKYPVLGDAAPLAVEALTSSTEWSAEEVEAVLRKELDLDSRGLPTAKLTNPAIYAEVMRAFRSYSPKDASRTPAAAEAESASVEEGDAVETDGAPDPPPPSFDGDDWMPNLEVGLMALAIAFEDLSGADMQPISSAEYLALRAPASVGNRTGEPVTALMRDHFGLSDPREFPASLFQPLMALLDAFPATDDSKTEPAFEQPPPGWRRWQRPELVKFAEKIGAAAPVDGAGTGASGAVINFDWAGAITARLKELTREGGAE